jgi:hypothetical protein
MLKLCISVILVVFIFWMGCRNESKMLNPNGDSELAILMRDMFDEGMLVKQSIIKGENPEMQLNYDHIHTATPTEEGKNKSTEYQLFAKAYAASVERFKNSTATDRPAAYQNMIDNCMSCHKSVCQGPMVRIKKMYLTEEQMTSVK